MLCAYAWCYYTKPVTKCKGCGIIYKENVALFNLQKGDISMAKILRVTTASDYLRAKVALTACGVWIGTAERYLKSLSRGEYPTQVFGIFEEIDHVPQLEFILRSVAIHEILPIVEEKLIELAVPPEWVGGMAIAITIGAFKNFPEHSLVKCSGEMFGGLDEETKRHLKFMYEGLSEEEKAYADYVRDS